MTNDTNTLITIGYTPDGQGVQMDAAVLIDTRQVITAASGGGKSYLLRRIVERVLDCGLAQVILIDPEGDFRTLDLITKGDSIKASPDLFYA